jgi:hypothetical protein
MIQSPVSLVTDRPYPKDTRLGLLAPGLLTVGDVPHLAALCAPRPLVIFGGLTGRSLDLLGENSLRQTFSFTQAVYQAHRKPESLTIAYSLAWKDLIARL